ncbi:type-2 ice-structuring protein-like [Mercenaria mercenaria]|uniref:type-2 ice-structuring protein-like n=1 Tax=Mercenaria mercenaria TaxID=6596 RepID=UPI00234ED93E|nr:type-2 ice-structuring protein-like [Mercenaria mercenaria]
MYFVRNIFQVISLYTLTIFAAFSMEKSLLFVKNTQYDGYMCEYGDIAASFDNIKNGRMCLSACAAHRCARVFYFPDSDWCLGCFSLHIRNSLLVKAGSIHYEARLQCPSTHGQFNTSCYTYTDTRMTMDDAKTHCGTLNGNIVTIESSDENGYVISWLQQQLLTSTNLTIWAEVHGNEQNFTIWESVQLDNGLCMENDGCEANEILLPVWYDVPCSESHRVVCEISLI